MKVAPWVPTEAAEVKRSTHGPLSFYMRVGTADEVILKEHLRGKGGLAGRLHVGVADRVLDIGAHIGVFAVKAANCGAHVLAYEPDPSNALLLRKNAKLNAGVVEVRERAIAGQAGFRSLYVSPAGRTYSSSLHVRRGREPTEVWCDAIEGVVRTYRPTVIKMDCEGTELEIIEACGSWEGVREMAIEYHVSSLRDQSLAGYRRVLALLEQDFNVEAPRHESGAWQRNIYVTRKENGE